jgi:UDP-N-acetylglucosamine enolpyruvyl transferase
MSSLLIEGGHRLEGRVSVEGNKNAALPLLAACLLTDQECVLTNVPRIGDVEVMARLLLDVGAEVEGIGTTTLHVKTPSIRTYEPARALVGPRPAATFQHAARSRRISRHSAPWAPTTTEAPITRCTRRTG